jgi:hypothetical protein
VLRQLSLSFGGPVESAYPAIPNPSPAELMAKRVLNSQPPAKGAGRLPPSARPKQTRIPGADDRFIITASKREWIRKMILAWDTPTIGWDAVLVVVRKKYPKGKLARQSLAKYEPLQMAFQATKRRLAQEREEGEAAKLIKAGKPAKPAKPKSGSEEYLDDRIKVLERHVLGLQEENAKLKQQFARWQLNAFAAGMTMQELDRRRGRADRGQADE